MSVNMQRVEAPQDTDCLICLETFEANTKAFGHPIPNSLDNKIYGHVHEKCLKTAIGTSQSFKCPHCRLLIRANSVYSWRDLNKNQTSQMVRKIVFNAVLGGCSAALGACIIKNVMARNDMNDSHIYKATALGALIGSFSSAMDIPFDSNTKFVKMAFPCVMGAISGFYGSIIPFNYSGSTIKTMGVAALTVSSMVGCAELIGTKLSIDKGISELD